MKNNIITPPFLYISTKFPFLFITLLKGNNLSIQPHTSTIRTWKKALQFHQEKVYVTIIECKKEKKVNKNKRNWNIKRKRLLTYDNKTDTSIIMVAKSYLHKVVKRLENPFAAVPFFVRWLWQKVAVL